MRILLTNDDGITATINIPYMGVAGIPAIAAAGVELHQAELLPLALCWSTVATWPSCRPSSCRPLVPVLHQAELLAELLPLALRLVDGGDLARRVVPQQEGVVVAEDREDVDGQGHGVSPGDGVGLFGI